MSNPIIPRNAVQNRPMDVPAHRVDDVRKLVGRNRTDINPKLRLYMTTVPGNYQFTSHLMFTIDGTPPRGMVLVSAGTGDLALDCLTRRNLTVKQSQFLRKFAIEITGVAVLEHLPLGALWIDSPCLGAVATVATLEDA